MKISAEYLMHRRIFKFAFKSESYSDFARIRHGPDMAIVGLDKMKHGLDFDG